MCFLLIIEDETETRIYWSSQSSGQGWYASFPWGTALRKAPAIHHFPIGLHNEPGWGVYDWGPSWQWIVVKEVTFIGLGAGHWSRAWWVSTSSSSQVQFTATECHRRRSSMIVETDGRVRTLPKTTQPGKSALWRCCLCVMLALYHGCYRVEDVMDRCMPSTSVKNTLQSRRAALLFPKLQLPGRPLLSLSVCVISLEFWFINQMWFLTT